MRSRMDRAQLPGRNQLWDDRNKFSLTGEKIILEHPTGIHLSHNRCCPRVAIKDTGGQKAWDVSNVVKHIDG
jgi:hypothetical protein